MGQDVDNVDVPRSAAPNESHGQDNVVKAQ